MAKRVIITAQKTSVGVQWKNNSTVEAMAKSDDPIKKIGAQTRSVAVMCGSNLICVFIGFLPLGDFNKYHTGLGCNKEMCEFGEFQGKWQAGPNRERFMKRFLVVIVAVMMAGVAGAQTTQPLSNADYQRKMDALNKKASTQPVQSRGTFCVVPIIGDIGGTVTGAAVSRVLDAALPKFPKVVVFVFDTDGGRTDEVGPIIEQIKRCRGTKVVALVDKAYSAGAIIALACPTIYMKKGGEFGGAVPFSMTKTGIKDVDAKFHSIWMAQCRAAAIQGGHSPLIAEGMVDSDVELMLRADKKIFKNDGLTPGTVIKAKGDILTMTSEDATRIGAVDGVAEDFNTLRSDMGFDQWTDVCRNAIQLFFGNDAQVRASPPVDRRTSSEDAIWRGFQATYPGVDVKSLWWECVGEAVQIVGKDDEDQLERFASVMFHSRAAAMSRRSR